MAYPNDHSITTIAPIIPTASTVLDMVFTHILPWWLLAMSAVYTTMLVVWFGLKFRDYFLYHKRPFKRATDKCDYVTDPNPLHDTKDDQDLYSNK